MTNSIEEVKNCELLFLIGCNPTEAHPVMSIEMYKAIKNGAKVIVCDPRKIWFAQFADYHIQLRPGSDNMLINAMMNVIINEKIYDKKFVEELTEGFDWMLPTVMDVTPEMAAEKCGVSADDIRAAARLFATTKKAAIFYTLGITEHVSGTENVRSLANLAMLTGHVGKESTGVNPIRGQNNVQGACDMGAMPWTYPGYQKVSVKENRKKFSKAYGVTMPSRKGYVLTEMFQSAHRGKLKAMYIMGENPVMSEPDQKHIIESMKKLEFIVVQEIFMTETSKLADVILPGNTFAERNGTYTNTERRIQRSRKAIESRGESRPDWLIICDLAKRMGYDKPWAADKYDSMDFPGAKEIWDEIAALTPSMAGINYGRIEKVGIQWPCPTTDHPGTKYLHKGQFARGKGVFAAIPFKEAAELPSRGYPLILVTGRTLYHYNSGTMTLRATGVMQKQPENFIEVHFDDAKKLRIKDADKVTVKTRRGEVQAKVVLGERVKRGTIWMPFHFPENPANRLTNQAFDDITKTAEYKVCAAKILR